MNGAGTRVLRRAGGAAITLALVVLGLAAGMWLGGPARADDVGTIEIRMAGEQAFSSMAPRPLLDVSGLAPGASVTGTMLVRDRSGNDGSSGAADRLTLRMVDVHVADACPAGAQPCSGSGAALAAALRLDLAVSDPASGAVLRDSAETVTSLQRGVPLATGLIDGATVQVRLSASLPADTTGNEVQYGRVAFDLQLGLSGATGSSTVVVGPGGGLAFTGAPIGWLAGAGLVALAAGLILIAVGRRRGRRGEPVARAENA